MDAAATALQSAFFPHGPEAEAIARLGWVMTAGAVAILALVTVLAWLALRAPRPWLARPATIVTLGIAFPTVVLVALMAYATVVAPRPYTDASPAVEVQLVGHQWWWEVRYLDAGGGHDFTTANEIRIPVGRPVRIHLASADVLHSFWVPSLAGKLDLVPGRDNALTLAAHRPGIYRGQCAEYCGGPHALMALHVLAEEPAAFEAWRSRQRSGASDPTGEMATRGRAIFTRLCAACHTVLGTPAAGKLGPDLTHLATRRTLAAGTLTNDAAGRMRWLVAGQHAKPGNLMPEFGHLAPGELDQIAAYLATLR